MELPFDEKPTTPPAICNGWRLVGGIHIAPAARLMPPCFSQICSAEQKPSLLQSQSSYA
jgi:hypothetical protein